MSICGKTLNFEKRRGFRYPFYLFSSFVIPNIYYFWTYKIFNKPAIRFIVMLLIVGIAGVLLKSGGIAALETLLITGLAFFVARFVLPEKQKTAGTPDPASIPAVAITFNGNNESVADAIEELLNIAHQNGIAGIAESFDDIVVDSKTGMARFSKLSNAHFYYRTNSFAFRRAKDLDRLAFNRKFNCNILTEESVRALLAEERAKYNEWYAPIDFGNGLAIGKFWTTGAGTGRWEFFDRAIVAPIIQNKSVLDLGANIGAMGILMLQAGAKRIVGFEKDPAFVESSRVIQKVYEWRDTKKYPLEIREGNMLEILNLQDGSFDVVTAFCSLYYLNEEDMARVTRKASTIAPRIILQANLAKASNEHRQRRSSPDFLKEILLTNGFPEVQVHSFPGYSRPILIGETAAAAIVNSEKGSVSQRELWFTM